MQLRSATAKKRAQQQRQKQKQQKQREKNFKMQNVKGQKNSNSLSLKKNNQKSIKKPSSKILLKNNTANKHQLSQPSSSIPTSLSPASESYYSKSRKLTQTASLQESSPIAVQQYIQHDSVSPLSTISATYSDDHPQLKSFSQIYQNFQKTQQRQPVPHWTELRKDLVDDIIQDIGMQIRLRQAYSQRNNTGISGQTINSGVLPYLPPFINKQPKTNKLVTTQQQLQNYLTNRANGRSNMEQSYVNKNSSGKTNKNNDKTDIYEKYSPSYYQQQNYDDDSYQQTITQTMFVRIKKNNAKRLKDIKSQRKSKQLKSALQSMSKSRSGRSRSDYHNSSYSRSSSQRELWKSNFIKANEQLLEFDYDFKCKTDDDEESRLLKPDEYSQSKQPQQQTVFQQNTINNIIPDWHKDISITKRMRNHYQSYPELAKVLQAQQPQQNKSTNQTANLSHYRSFSYSDRYIYKDYDIKTHTYCSNTLVNELYQKQLNQCTTLFFPQLSQVLRKKWSQQYEEELVSNRNDGDISQRNEQREYLFDQKEIHSLALMIGLKKDCYYIQNRNICLKNPQILDNVHECYHNMDNSELIAQDELRVYERVGASASNNKRRKANLSATSHKKKQLQQKKQQGSNQSSINKSNSHHLKDPYSQNHKNFEQQSLFNLNSYIRPVLKTPSNFKRKKKLAIGSNQQTQQHQVQSQIDWLSTIEKSALNKKNSKSKKKQLQQSFQPKYSSLYSKKKPQSKSKGKQTIRKEAQKSQKQKDNNNKYFNLFEAYLINKNRQQVNSNYKINSSNNNNS